MRFKKHKCGDQFGCRYEMTEASSLLDDDIPCDVCGLTYNETRTVWDRIQHGYWRIMPYNWRPKNAWYNFTCWAWKRYTTVKPRNLGHTWCDRSHLLPHVMFEILCDFVEKEYKPDQERENWSINWDSDPAHAHARDEMLALYEWWTEKYLPNEDYPWHLPEEERNKIDDLLGAEQVWQEELRTNCKRLINIMPYMWT